MTDVAELLKEIELLNQKLALLKEIAKIETELHHNIEYVPYPVYPTYPIYPNYPLNPSPWYVYPTVTWSSTSLPYKTGVQND